MYTRAHAEGTYIQVAPLRATTRVSLCRTRTPSGPRRLASAMEARKRRAAIDAPPSPPPRVTKRELHKRQRSQHAAAAAEGNAIPVDTEQRRTQRQRAEERHKSASYPAWDMYAWVRNAGGWGAIPVNPHFHPRLPIVSNFVATAQCMGCVPDMTRMVYLFAGRRKHGVHARPVSASLWVEGAALQIQTSTGILNLTGNKSPSSAVIACWAYKEAVARHLHVPLQLAKFDVYNAHATFSVGGIIDLRALHRAVPPSNYEPDLISAVAITIRDPRVTVLVWASGAVVVNGCRTREEHMRVYHDFGRFLSQFVRAGAAAHEDGAAEALPDDGHTTATRSAAVTPGFRRTGATRIHRQANGAVGLRPTLWAK